MPRRRGHLLLIAARIATVPIGVASTVVLARWLGVTDFGLYATALSVVLFTFSAPLAGFDQLYLKRELALRSLARHIRIWCLFLLALATLLALLYPALPLAARVCLVLLAAGMAGTTLAAPALLEPQASLDYATRGRRELAYKFLGVAPVLLVVWLPPSLPLAGAAFLVGGGIVYWLSSSHLPAAASADVQRDRDFSKQLRRGAPFAAASATFAVTRQVPVLGVALVRTPDDVAQFRAALTIYAAMQLLPAVINGDVLRPRLYRTATGWPRLLAGSLAANLCLGIAGAAATFSLADWVIDLIFGPAFGPAAEILRWLALAFPIFCVASWFDTLNAARGQAKVMLTRLGLALAITTVAVTVAAPLGSVEVARAVLVAEAAGIVLVLGFEVRRTLKQGWN